MPKPPPRRPRQATASKPPPDFGKNSADSALLPTGVRGTNANVIRPVGPGLFPEHFEAAARAALKLSKTAEQKLPQQIARLSSMLTSRRALLAAQAYWSRPELAAAYLWYFLPWNLLRLSSLLPGLPLRLEPESRCLDAGSGPLTFPLALWLSCPAWRETPLHFYCLDASSVPLQLGIRLFRELTGEHTPWRFTPATGPMFRALPKLERGFKLVSACNMLNELRPQRQASLAGHISGQVDNLLQPLQPAGNLLLVEPGNRLGGKIISSARKSLLKRGGEIPTPCPHAGLCPLSAEREEALPGAPVEKAWTRPAAWCHFRLERQNIAIPAWLDELSRKARLPKESLSLSFLLADKGGGPPRPAGTRPKPGQIPGRVVSHRLPLPGRTDHSYYLCTEQGLLLAHTKEILRPGDGVLVCLNGTEARDPKSGALVVENRA